MEPKSWRIGREQGGMSSIYYQDVWVARVDVKTCKTCIAEWTENPPDVLYPTLYKQGELDLKAHNLELGVRRLIKEELITPDEALSVQPKIRAWLKRTGRLTVEPVGDVTFDNKLYKRVNRKWCCWENGSWVPLPEKANFKSTWEARVAYATGKATLKDVAEYGWGAVLEVVGDCIYKTPEDPRKEAILDEQLRAQIDTIINTPTYLTGFTKKGELWSPRRNVVEFWKNSAKRRQFWKLYADVFATRKSGYEAHLEFVNGFPKRISFEKNRWNYTGDLYAPVLIGRRAKVESCETLAQARDLVRKTTQELIAVGFAVANEKKAYFKYRQNTYGVWLKSGKVFSMHDASRRYIPVNFDKWAKEKQARYLGEDDEYLIAQWEKQARANRRLYYFLRCVKRIPARQAYLIAGKKWLRLNDAYLRKIRAAGRWACYHANKALQEVK